MRRNRLNEMDWDRIHDDLSKDRRLNARRLTNKVNDYISSTEYSLRYKKAKATNENIKQLVNDAIEKDGPNCDLNWIDTSEVTKMNYLFSGSQFNGDISNWDVSNVTDMRNMFEYSLFNGDISNWNVSNVTDMNSMFYKSQFNGDISNWDVSNVTDMSWMFEDSKFKGDISNWQVNPDCKITCMFDKTSRAIADWYMVESRKSLTNKKALYESIMKSVSKQVKKALNEGYDIENREDIISNIIELVRENNGHYNFSYKVKNQYGKIEIVNCDATEDGFVDGCDTNNYVFIPWDEANDEDLNFIWKQINK